jgi:hypothetical protein
MQFGLTVCTYLCSEALFVLTYVLTHSLTHTLTHTHTHTHTLTHTLTHTHTHTLTHSLTHLLTHTLTHSLTPCSRFPLEKLTDLQPVNKFPALYETRMFITAFTSPRQLSISWAITIHSIPPHPTSLRSTLILPSHLSLFSQVVSFPQVSPPKSCMRLSLPLTCYMRRHYYSSPFHHLNNIVWAEQVIKLLIM